MKLTKSNIINYLVDVLGYSEEEARQEISIYGTNCLTEEQTEECIKFNS